MIMHSTRTKYHPTIKQLRKCEKELKRQKFAESTSVRNAINFWNEANKVGHSVNPVTSVVEKMCLKEDICDVFAAK